MAAGQRLLELRAGHGSEPATGKSDDLRKAGDLLAHEFLAAELAARRPADAVLSEEGKDDAGRLSAERVWIVDPLDGTREFGELGRTDWAVHVALWERGDLTAGAVALPARDLVLSTLNPPPPPPPPRPGHAGGEADLSGVRIVVSRSRPPEFVQRMAAATGAELVPMGSAGAKAAMVVLGECDAYVHAGGQYEWDSAAPVAVARAAGLHTSRIDGSALAYNQADVSIPDILISPAWLAPRLLAEIARASAGGEPASAPAGPSSSDPEFSS